MLLFAPLLVVSATAARGQDELVQPPFPPGAGDQPGQESFLGRETMHNLYVRDSSVAVENFALAQRMERLREWDKAADALQVLIEQHADRVIPSRTDEENVIVQYTSVVLAAQERLARWPEEGLAVYRARYEPAAETLLGQALTTDDLNTVYSRYFATESGKAAGIRLIDRSLEAGEFAAAAWIAQRLLDWHPTIGDDRPALLYRAAIALHLGGDSEGARHRLEELKTQHANATGTVRGEEVVLAESFARELDTPVPHRQAFGVNSWPTVGGDFTRGRIIDAPGHLNAKIYDIAYDLTLRGEWDNPALRQLVQEEERDREQGYMLGVMPVAADGQLFFQDNARVYAVSIDSGLPLPGWTATYGDRNGRFELPDARPLPRNQQFTLTVTDDAVLGVMGQPDRLNFARGLGLNEGESRLVCLDRQTGVERWILSRAQLPEEISRQPLVSLGSTPIVVGDSVFVMARAGAPMQFEDTYVVAVGLADGKVRWTSYLASGFTAAEAWDAGLGLSGSGFSDMAYAHGRLYALTNIGALAAVHPHDGSIIWLSLYPRPKVEARQFRMHWSRMREIPPDKPWTHNQLIASGDSIFALPDDGQDVLVYDAGTGATRRAIPLTSVDGARTLLGVVGDEIIVASDARVLCVNWRQFDPGAAERRASPVWVQHLAPVRGATESILGRGVVTDDAVFVPTTWAVHRIDRRSGKLVQTYPAEGDWGEDEGPGNVLVVGEHVIVAGTTHLNGYTDLSIAQARLDAAVDAAPQDPEPRLRYAEVMFVAGENDLALAKLDEAMALMGGASSPAPGAARDRLFNIAVTFADALASGAPARAANPALASDLFDRAGIAADAPAQQVHYRVARARFAEGQKDDAQAVRLYQEILSDRALAQTLYSGDATGSRPAAVLAERMITEAIARSGPDVYAPYERAAEQALAAARQSNDLTDLLAVADEYPNARVAPQAMLAAGELLERQGAHRRASRVLGEVYRKYRDSADVTGVLEAQARNFLTLPDGLGAAIGRLAEASKRSAAGKLTKPLTLPDGTTIAAGTRLGDALRTLRTYSSAQAQARLADFGLPVPDPNERPRRGPFVSTEPRPLSDAIRKLLVPAAPALSRDDRVVTWSQDGRIGIWAIGRSEPAAQVPLDFEPEGVAWVDGRLLAWGGSRMASIQEDLESPVWTVSTGEWGAIDPVAARNPDLDVRPPGAGGEADEAIVLDGQAVQFRRQRNLRRMRGGAMVAVPQPQPVPAPANGAEMIQHVTAVGDRIVLSTTSGRVAALDAGTGSVSWQVRLVAAPIDQIEANYDFVVARVAQEGIAQITAMDMASGELLVRRLFPQNGRGPVNMALSAEGMLVFLHGDQLSGTDLHAGGKELVFTQPERRDGMPLFYGAAAPGQLVIAEGRILAVSDNGQFVRVHSLQTGRELIQPLNTGADNWAVQLRVVGPRLYVVNQKTVVSYNLDQPAESWRGSSVRNSGLIEDGFVGQDYVVLLEQVRGRPQQENEPASRYRLLAYARYPINPGESRESGRLDHIATVSHPLGITTWQPVQGGFYYRTADHKLFFLKGADGTIVNAHAE